jgi:hypothetical protein
MTETNLYDEKIFENEAILVQNKRRWTAALFTAVVFGVFSSVVGLLVGALHFFGYLNRQNGVGRLGAMLIALAFPLLMFGAHAMDKIAETDERQNLRARETEKRKQYRPEQWKKDEHTQL